MENPPAEIKDVIYGLVRAENPDEQREVLQRYFLPNASFDHPLCSVNQSRNSRDAGILQVYQFLRSIFKDTEIEIHSVAFDKEKNRMYVDATQHLRTYINWFRKLFYDRYANLVVVLDLRQLDDGKYYVRRQIDLYTIQEESEVLIPGDFIIKNFKAFIGFMLIVYVTIFQLFGIWKPRK